MSPLRDNVLLPRAVPPSKRVRREKLFLLQEAASMSPSKDNVLLRDAPPSKRLRQGELILLQETSSTSSLKGLDQRLPAE